MYRIIPLPELHRVELWLDGAFDYDPRIVLHELKRTVPGICRADRSFDYLADFSRVRRIPVPHARAGETVMEWCRAHGLRKCASVMVSAEQRMVVERKTANDPRFDFFLTREDAEWWLARE